MIYLYVWVVEYSASQNVKPGIFGRYDITDWYLFYLVTLDINGKIRGILLENFSPNGEWEVKKTRAQWLEHWLGHISFSKIRFSLTLKRKVHLLLNNLLFVLVWCIDKWIAKMTATVNSAKGKHNSVCLIHCWSLLIISPNPNSLISMQRKCTFKMPIHAKHPICSIIPELNMLTWNVRCEPFNSE